MRLPQPPPGLTRAQHEFSVGKKSFLAQKELRIDFPEKIVAGSSRAGGGRSFQSDTQTVCTVNCIKIEIVKFIYFFGFV